MISKVVFIICFSIIPVFVCGQDIDDIAYLEDILNDINHQEKKETTSPLFFVFTFLVVGLFLYFKFFYEVTGKTNSDLPFSYRFPPTKRNVRYAYKVIGYYVLYSENDDLKGQYKYLVGYLRNLFPEEKKFDGQLFAGIREEFEGINEPVIWLRRVLSKDQCPQVIDFMIDLAYYNGRVSRRELHLIYQAGKLLRLTEKEIQSILTMRQNHYKEQERERRERRSQFASTINRSTKKNASLRILGLPNTTNDFQEVRKAYRELARKYHPDRFVNTEKGERKMAHERFVQINNAHDYLKEILEG